MPQKKRHYESKMENKYLKKAHVYCEFISLYSRWVFKEKKRATSQK